MNSVTIASNTFGWVLQTSLQAAVLVLLVLIAQIIFRNKLSPAGRYGLWLLVLVRLLMPASPQSAISIFNLAKFVPGQPVTAAPELSGTGAREVPVSDLKPPSQPSENRMFNPPGVRADVSPAWQPDDAHPAGAISTRSVWLHRPANWFGIACAVWLGGICLLALRVVWAHVRFCSRLARHAPVADAATIRLVEDCSNTLGISRQISVIETEEVESPAVSGLWKKRLLLPDGVFERFSSEELPRQRSIEDDLGRR